MSDIIIIKADRNPDPNMLHGAGTYVQVVDVVENGSGIMRCKELYGEYQHAGAIEFHVIHGAKADIQVSA